MAFHPQEQQPIQEGDAGIVLTADGGFYIFSVGDPNDRKPLTPMQADQAVVLNAFKMALHVPPAMHVLVTMAADPRVMSGVELAARHDRPDA